MPRKSSQFCRPYVQVHRHSDDAPAPTYPWTLPELCAAYGWPSGLPGGGVIALIELDGGWVQSDMDTFFASIDQPAPQLVDISLDGKSNKPNLHAASPDDPDSEVAMDIQVAAASYYLATGKPATLRIYWTDDIAAAVTRATADGCDVCSISWGSDEGTWGQSDAHDMEAAATAATAAGMVVLAAAGDNCSGDGTKSNAIVDVPASCPHVIGCGGTFKTLNDETVWDDTPGQYNGRGTGGGYSALFPPQSFQLGAPAPPSSSAGGKGRMVPDVAGNADPNSGYTVYVHGATRINGGTSAVAPLYAGLFAAMGKKLGFITPQLWKNQHAFRNITTGSNGAYSAGPGPNPCSGLGAPNASVIASLFAVPA